MLREARGKIDYLSIHQYIPEEEYKTVVASPRYIEEMIRSVQQTIEEINPESRIGIAFDEWNVTAKNFTLRDALFTAGMLNTFIRQCNSIKMSTPTSLNDIFGTIMANKIDTYSNPSYYVFQLYSEHLGNNAITTEAKCKTFTISRKKIMDVVIPSMKVPYLDCAATISDNGKSLCLMVLNRHETESIQTLIQLENFIPTAKMELWQINGPDVKAVNDFKNEMVNRAEQKTISAAERFHYRFPAHSITLMKLLRARPNR